MTHHVSFVVNGAPVSAAVEARLSLADFLRGQRRLTGTHLGCEHGVCGACNVLIDGAPARSCITYTVTCDGAEIRTIEGFGTDATMEELREAFSREHALQCGFCTPGMLITAHDLVSRLGNVDEKRIRTELSGNLCRCTGYVGIVRAIRSVLERRALVGAVPATAVPPIVLPAATASAPTSATEPAARKTAAQTPLPTAARNKAWTTFEQSFVIECPPAAAWELLKDFPRVTACFPGATLEHYDGHNVRGRLAVRLGLVSASFAGAAAIELDDNAMTGVAKGAGSDSSSRSRTRGELAYRITPERDGSASRVSVSVAYDLQGPLAQFSRAGFAQEVGAQLISEFAKRLNGQLRTPAGEGSTTAMPAAQQLSMGRILLTALWRQLRSVFGRR